MPPNPSILAPGPVLIFVNVNGVPSMGKMIMVGSGQLGQQPVSAVVDLPPVSMPASASGNGNSGGKQRQRQEQRGQEYVAQERRCDAPDQQGRAHHGRSRDRSRRAVSGYRAGMTVLQSFYVWAPLIIIGTLKRRCVCVLILVFRAQCLLHPPLSSSLPPTFAIQ